MTSAEKDIQRLMEVRKNEPEEVAPETPQEFEMTETEFLRFENLALKKKMMQFELDQLSSEVLIEIRDRLQVPSGYRIAHNLEKKKIAILPPEPVEESNVEDET